MSRWDRWSNSVTDKKGFGSFLKENNPSAALGPAERAKQLGLQSNGKGGYIDPSTGELVARTVNGELIFYDTNSPDGGAVSDSEGGRNLVQKQPSWADPLTGQLTTPPANAESPQEIAAIPDPTPATAPAGYNSFMQQKKDAAYQQNKETPQPARMTPDEAEQQDAQAQQGDPAGGQAFAAEERKTLNMFLEADPAEDNRKAFERNKVSAARAAKQNTASVNKATARGGTLPGELAARIGNGARSSISNNVSRARSTFQSLQSPDENISSDSDPTAGLDPEKVAQLQKLSASQGNPAQQKAWLDGMYGKLRSQASGAAVQPAQTDNVQSASQPTAMPQKPEPAQGLRPGREGRMNSESVTKSMDSHQDEIKSIMSDPSLSQGEKMKEIKDIQTELGDNITKMLKTLKFNDSELSEQTGLIKKQIVDIFDGMGEGSEESQKAYKLFSEMFGSFENVQNMSAQMRTHSDEQLDALEKQLPYIKDHFKVGENGLPDIEKIKEAIEDHKLYDFHSNPEMTKSMKKLFKSLPKDFKGKFGGQGWNGFDDFIEHIEGGGRDFLTKLPLPVHRRQIDHQIANNRSRDMTLPKETRDFIKDKYQIRGIDLALNQDKQDDNNDVAVQKILDKHPRMEQMQGAYTLAHEANSPRNAFNGSFRSMLRDMITEEDENGELTLKPGVDIESAVEMAKEGGKQQSGAMMKMLEERFNLDEMDLDDESREKAQGIYDNARSRIESITDSKGDTDIFRALNIPTTFAADPSHGGGIPQGDYIMHQFLENQIKGSDNPQEAIKRWRDTIKSANSDSAKAWNGADRTGLNEKQAKEFDKNLKGNNAKNFVMKMIENGILNTDSAEREYNENDELIKGFNTNDKEGLKSLKDKKRRLKAVMKMIQDARGNMNESVDLGMDEDDDMDPFEGQSNQDDILDILPLLQQLMGFEGKKGKKSLEDFKSQG
jgi:hypothetical protein